MHDVIFGGYGFIGNELFKRIKNCKRYSNTRKIAKKNLIAYNENACLIITRLCFGAYGLIVFKNVRYYAVRITCVTKKQP